MIENHHHFTFLLFTFYNARKRGQKGSFTFIEGDCKRMSDLRSVKLKDKLYEEPKYTHKKSLFLSNRDMRRILRTVEKNHRITLNNLAIQKIPGPTIGMSLIQQVRRQNCFEYCVPSAQLFLKKCHKIERKLWTKAYKNYTNFDWVTVIWSVKSHFGICFLTREQPPWIKYYNKRSENNLIMTRPIVPGNRRKVGV